MGKVHNGGFSAATGFTRENSEPLRDDEVWEYLDDLKTIPKAYEGITVYVLETKAWYYWNGVTQSNLTNWKGFGGISDLLQSKLNNIDGKKVVAANTNYTFSESTDNYRTVFLRNNSVLVVPNSGSTRLSFNARCLKVTDNDTATVTFASQYVGEDDSTPVGSIVLNAGESMNVTRLSTGEIVITK